jgi:hypothetical protein
MRYPLVGVLEKVNWRKIGEERVDGGFEDH